MMRFLAGLLAVVVVTPGSASAHRLDEYLQASRLSLDREGLALELDLTPGAALAPAIVAMLDRDGDGVIAPAEARRYAEQVLREIAVQLDGRNLAVSLTSVEMPAIDQMTAGLGTIRVRASAAVPRLAAGARVLYFRNGHRPEGSVYLANALVPAG